LEIAGGSQLTDARILAASAACSKPGASERRRATTPVSKEEIRWAFSAIAAASAYASSCRPLRSQLTARVNPRLRESRFRAPIETRLPSCSRPSRTSPSGGCKKRPSLTPAARDGQTCRRSGRKNDCGAVEQKNRVNRKSESGPPRLANERMFAAAPSNKRMGSSVSWSGSR
jgi:hypothetical protein